MSGVAVLCLLAGGGFGLIGSLGLLRLPTPMMRLHAPTKATTLGLGGVLAAAILRGQVWDTFPLSAVLIAAFLLATAPITAMMLARLAMAEGEAPPLEGAITETAASHRG